MERLAFGMELKKVELGHMKIRGQGKQDCTEITEDMNQSGSTNERVEGKLYDNK